MAETSIEWADKVWNPVTGCTKVSQGCKHCYAETIAGRFWAKQYPPNPDGSPRKFTDVRIHPERLEEPCHWKKPARVFVNSMSDLFHQDVPDDFIVEVFGAMAVAGLVRGHTFMILTKRPERMQKLFAGYMGYSHTWFRNQVADAAFRWAQDRVNAGAIQRNIADWNWPLRNVWLGVSVEDQWAANNRIPDLLRTPAAVRFVSCEPLLEQVDLTRIKWAKIPIEPENYQAHGIPAPLEMWSMRNVLWSAPGDEYNPPVPGIDWVIVGGESGQGARPMSAEWVKSLRDQCQASGTAFFFKQWGAYEPAHLADGTPTFLKVGKKAAGRRLGGREWNEYPEVKG